MITGSRWTLRCLGIGVGACALMSAASADIVHNDDVIIDGSLCVGLDCVNGESFGSDTIRLKENNLRIRAQDTSTSASFPSNDWLIVFNDSANGGLNKFSINDETGGTTPFTIEAGAPSHSLYVDDGGRIGLGTSAPLVDVHLKTGNTPTVRLEQDGSSGFTPQTWDVAGNEANFFVRDATHGSRLVLRIQPDAPNNALFIEGSTGDMGIGTNSPADAIHIREPASSPNNGAAIRFEETDSADPGRLVMLNDVIYLQFVDGAGTEFSMDTTGNVTIQGTLTQNSDKNSKMAIVGVDETDILDKVGRLQIAEWSYKGDDDVRHIGPMAQDFYALFKTGASEQGISALDAGGVALASIKALRKENERAHREIADLNARLAELEKRLAGKNE